MSATTVADDSASGYWYRNVPPLAGAVEVLNALRRYREAELAMRKRTQAAMHMGETDMKALRYLLAAKSRGASLTPKELSTRLGISTASVSVLLDRLEKSGHIVRQRHPTNRKSILISTTADTDVEVRGTLSQMHDRMMEVTKRLSPEEAATVLSFLHDMTAAVDSVDVEPA
jgi:DNA-binding MarR family transcriptional regulator